jgi:hypothetical protein
MAVDDAVDAGESLVQLSMNETLGVALLRVRIHSTGIRNVIENQI